VLDSYAEFVVAVATVGMAAVIRLLSLRFEEPNLLDTNPHRLWTEVAAVHFELIIVALSMLLLAEFTKGTSDRSLRYPWICSLLALFMMLAISSIVPKPGSWTIVVGLDVLGLVMTFWTGHTVRQEVEQESTAEPPLRTTAEGQLREQRR
jgi:hypothetical protein